MIFYTGLSCFAGGGGDYTHTRLGSYIQGFYKGLAGFGFLLDREPLAVLGFRAQ